MLNKLIELSKDDSHESLITVNKIETAKELIRTTPNNNKELFNILAAMNLINAALRRKEFKSKEKDALIYYGLLKRIRPTNYKLGDF